MNKAKPLGLALALLLALGPAHSATRAAEVEPPQIPIGGALIVDRSDDTNVTTCEVASNDCTLRGAINKVNLSGVGQEIQFAPAITQVNLSAPLPTLNIAGTIIRGTAGVPRINGANLAGSGDDMFTLDTGDARITGLTMINGRRSDIMVKSGAANQIDHNYLGVASPLATDCLTGGATRMGSVGIWLQENVSASGGTSVWIHGNVIGCHEFDGISAFGADDTKIGIDPAGAPSGNWVGTTAAKIGGSYTGEILPNRHGIALDASGANGARRNVIRNNVVANNAQIGVLLEGNGINDVNGTSANTIAANLIVNNLTGIWLSQGAFWNVIGGAADGDGNLVYANTNNGINVYDSDLNGILGNTIGAQDSATANNGLTGILIANGKSNWIGGVFVVLTAFERGNVIAGNGDAGIWLTGGSGKNTVTRNWIGNTPSGAIRPNGNDGILIDAGAYSNTIGTGVISQLNVIGGNNGAGIVIDGSATMSNAVRFNDIGVNSALTAVSGPLAARDAGAPMAAATIALPNDHGIVIRNGAHDNTVADSNWIAENRNNGVWLYTGAAENIIGPNNVIFNNDGDGIALSDAATEFNTILTSTIYANRGDGIREYRSATNNAWVATRTYANGGLGIDKAAEASATNIPTAGWPVITSVVRSGGNVTLTGTSDASTCCLLINSTRVFVFHSGLDPSGYGEGQTFVGDAPTDSNGVWRLSYTDGATARCYSAYKRSSGFFISGYDSGSEFSPSTCVPKLAYVPRVLR